LLISEFPGVPEIVDEPGLMTGAPGMVVSVVVAIGRRDIQRTLIQLRARL
jgi:hypothetical protein